MDGRIAVRNFGPGESKRPGSGEGHQTGNAFRQSGRDDFLAFVIRFNR
jgi:hypothetical protein